jgi:hypothetical protein
MRVHDVFLERENHPLAVVLEAILQSRRILAGQPEIQGMPRYLSERFLRMPLQSSRQGLAPNLRPVRCRTLLFDHLPH